MVLGLFTSKSETIRQITLGDGVYPVEIVRRRNAKRLTLRVRDGAIFVTTPLFSESAEIEDFIATNTRWIETQLRKQRQALASINEEMGASRIYYQGEITPVRLERSPNHLGKGSVEDRDGELIIRMNTASRMRPARLLEAWLKDQASRAISRHLTEILPLLGEESVPISIRSQKTRWGSCSSTRRLSFNWRLIMAPPLSLRYVVAHEAAHLKHHDHSPKFWQQVADLMPDYKPHQQWLKKNQVALFADLDHRLKNLEA